MDIAAIGFEVKTDSIQKGRKELSRFSQEAEKTTKSIGAAAKAAMLLAGAFAAIKITSLISNITMANSRFEQLGLVMGVVGRNAS